MENASCIACYQYGRLTAWSQALSPHMANHILAHAMNQQEANVRLIKP